MNVLTNYDNIKIDLLMINCYTNRHNATDITFYLKLICFDSNFKHFYLKNYFNK